MKPLLCELNHKTKYIREAWVIDCIPGFKIRGSRANTTLDIPVEEIEAWRLTNNGLHYFQVRKGTPTYQILQERFNRTGKEIADTLFYEPNGAPQHPKDYRNSDDFIQRYVTFDHAPLTVTIGRGDIWSVQEEIDLLNLKLSSKLSERSKIQTIREAMAAQRVDRVLVSISRDLYNATLLAPKWKED